MGALIFLGINLAAVGAASIVAGSLGRNFSGSQRGVVACAAFSVFVTVVLLGCGIIGVLRGPVVALVSVALGGVVAVAVRPWRYFSRGGLEASCVDDVRWRALGAALLAAFASVLVLRVFTYGTGYFSDDFGYHALAVVTWMREGFFAPMPPSFVAYYPFGSELFSLWFTLPFGHEGWAGLAGLFWVGFAVVALFAAARGLGADRGTAALVGALALGSPQISGFLARTFSATDLAGGVCLMGAALLAAQAVLATESRILLTVLAGCCGGIAVACKVSFAPATALLAISMGAVSGAWTRRLTLVVVFGISAMLLGGYWFGKNWLLTGNPLFPAEVGPFAGPLSRVDLRATTIFPTATAESHSVAYWFRLLRRFFDWPPALGVLSAAGYVGALCAEFTRASVEGPLARATRRRLLGVGAGLALLHPFTPFSTGAGVIAGEVIPYLRYVAPSFIVGIALFSSLLASGARYHRVFRVAAVVALVSTWPGLGKSLVFSVLAGGLTGWLVLKERAMWLSRLSRLTAAALFIAVPVLAARQKLATDRGIALTGSDERKPIGAAWAALDRLPDGARVAALTNMAYHRSPLFGTRWQLSPIFLHHDGTVRIPFHQEFRENPNVDWSFHEEWPTIDGEAWLARLRTSGVDYLFISRWADDDWPPPYAKLRGTGRCEALFDDGYSVIWKLPR